MIDKIEVTSQEFDEKYFYNGQDLGANYTKAATTFRLWSPKADNVTLYLYDKGYKSKPYDKVKMDQDIKGTWVCEVKEDLHGVYYTYEAEFEDEKYEFVDPYSRACGVNGERGMILDLNQTNPEDWEGDLKPRFVQSNDAIIYEGHVRDLTIHKSSGVTHNGKFLGLAEDGTRSYEGLPTGLDHLIELGVTHLHLLPVVDFDSIDESKENKAQYNWGFRTVNFNCLEGSYSTNPIDGEVRIKEFKTLVQTLHRNGIRLIVDLAFHTKDLQYSNLHKSFPHYYFRDASRSSYGNEMASEHLMVRKYIVDCVSYLAKEYHLDGFRFELMGLIDLETINEIRESLDQIDSSILIYGDSYLAGDSPLPRNQRVRKSYTNKMPRIALFNDECRDGLKGNKAYASQPGFVNGSVEMENTIKFAIVGAIDHPQIDFEKVIYSKKPWAIQPNQTINYASSHDDFTLYDKIVETTDGLDMETRIKMTMMANAIVLTSQGIPFIQAGSEMLRTKNGDKHSEQSPDMINQIVWSSKYDHQEVFDYYQGLIALRKAHPAFRMNSSEMIREHLQFLESPVSNTLGYRLTEGANEDEFNDIVVLFNANTSEVKFKLPHFGVWNVVVENDEAGTEVLRKFTGDEVIIPELTTMILYSNEKTVNEVTVVEQDKGNLKNIAKVAVGAVGLYLLLRRRRK
jgi:pullulanase